MTAARQIGQTRRCATALGQNAATAAFPGGRGACWGELCPPKAVELATPRDGARRARRCGQKCAPPEVRLTTPACALRRAARVRLTQSGACISQDRRVSELEDWASMLLCRCAPFKRARSLSHSNPQFDIDARERLDHLSF